MFKVGREMSKKILIDGAFKEETRVALIEDNVLQNYDREDFNFKQLKGNIYLAKVTRIEPSLQAAFIDYGGDRHGFLPFSDIHPDYYNIPKSEIKNLKEVKFFQINTFLHLLLPVRNNPQVFHDFPLYMI